MIRLRALHRDTGRRNSSHAESPASDPGEEEPDTSGLVAAANSEIELLNVPVSPAAADTPRPGAPPATNGHTLEPENSRSDEPNNQETASHQPDVRSDFGWHIGKFSLSRTVTVLGFLLAVVIAAVTWSGMNYANYYAKKSYELALYQACRTYDDLKNGSTCRNVLATGLVRIRSLSDVRPGSGMITAYLTELLDNTLIGHLRECENGAWSCLVRLSGPGVSYASFIPSIPEMRARLYFALFFRVVAIVYCREAIFDSQPWTRPTTMSVLGKTWITNISWMVPFPILDAGWALETGALSGQMSWKTIGSWAVYFTTTAAFPIFMSTAHKSYHTRLLLLSASVAILAPLGPKVSDVEANIALAITSMACYRLLLAPSRQPESLDPETLQEEGGFKDGLDSPQIGTPPGDVMEQRRAADQREESSHENEFPGTESHHREAGDSKTAPGKADNAPNEGGALPSERRGIENSGAVVPALGAFRYLSANSLGLCLAYLLSRALKANHAATGEIVFAVYCSLSLHLLDLPPVQILPQSLWKRVGQGEHTLDDVKACGEAQKAYAFYGVWGHLIATVWICIASVTWYGT